jgi:hypothetical protein
MLAYADVGLVVKPALEWKEMLAILMLTYADVC